MVRQVPVQVAAVPDRKVHLVKDCFSGVLQLSVGRGVIPVLIDGEKDPCVRGMAPDRSVADAEAPHIFPDIPVDVHSPHVVPVEIVVDLISDDPVRYAAIVRVLAGITFRQEGKERPGRLAAALGGCVEAVVKCLTVLSDAREHELRHPVIPAVQHNGRDHQVLSGKGADGPVVGRDLCRIELVGLSFISVAHACAGGEMREIEIHVDVLDSQFKGVVEHVQLHKKSFFCQRSPVFETARGSDLRIRDVGAVADDLVLPAEPDGGDIGRVQSGIHAPLVQRQGEGKVSLLLAACNRLSADLVLPGL